MFEKGDWTACESTLKALERSAMDEGGPRNPLSNISDNVRKIKGTSAKIWHNLQAETKNYVK